MPDTVRCRFAPAPSGSIHVGNARSALFSWLFARHSGGSFAETPTPAVSEATLRADRCDGSPDWDRSDVGPHGPYRQSERTDIYRELVDRLIADGNAYRCYCTAEELEAIKQEAIAKGKPPGGDDGRCLRLTDAERSAFEREGRPFTVRFAMPERGWVVDDLVKGEVRFPLGQLRDFVLVRSDGTPVFLLAVAVDDMLMEVTHVIRGDDLLASAPRNAAVIEALGGTPPRYAHRRRCSGWTASRCRSATARRRSRRSATGFLPEALMNYLALLGWSKDESTTFLSRDELVEAFDLSRVSSNPAAFDTKKLEWMNNHYIQSLGEDELAARCLHFLTESGPLPDPSTLRASMPTVRERMKTLKDSVTLLRFLFTDDVEPDEKPGNHREGTARLPREGGGRARGRRAASRRDHGDARRRRTAGG
jgi:glutamyl-tRNA synthetase